MPSAVVLSVFIYVGGCLCPISSSAWCSGTTSVKFRCRATSLDFSAEYTTVFIICSMVGMNPLFGGSRESLDVQ